jgi:hypothetical protein
VLLRTGDAQGNEKEAQMSFNETRTKKFLLLFSLIITILISREAQAITKLQILQGAPTAKIAQ